MSALLILYDVLVRTLPSACVRVYSNCAERPLIDLTLDGITNRKSRQTHPNEARQSEIVVLAQTCTVRLTQ